MKGFVPNKPFDSGNPSHRVAGVFHRAMWFVSAPGVALAGMTKASSSSSKIECRKPDTVSQRGWLAAWKELRKTAGKQHADCLRLIEIFLSSMSNSGAVDRYLGAVKLTSLRRGHVHQSGLEASLRLMVQTVYGRAEKKLNPTELLVQPSAGKTSSGMLVAQPASKFCLRAQHMYGLWFGRRKWLGRGLEPETQRPEHLLKSRLKATKPRLAPLKKTSDYTEAALLQRHAASMRSAVARVEQGGQAEGILCAVDLPAASSSGVDSIIAEQAAACHEIAKAAASSALEQGKSSEQNQGKNGKKRKRPKMAELVPSHSIAALFG